MKDSPVIPLHLCKSLLLTSMVSTWDLIGCNISYFFTPRLLLHQILVLFSPPDGWTMVTTGSAHLLSFCHPCVCFRWQWVPRDHGPLSAAITAAAFSCDSALVFAAFADGSLCVLEADTLWPRCRVAPAAYIPSPSR